MKNLQMKVASMFLIVLAIFIFYPEKHVKAENNEPKIISLTVRKGDSITIEIDDFTGPIGWQSSDDTIAHVSQDGKVYGINIGVATITATMEDESYIYKVTVKEPKKQNIMIGTDSFKLDCTADIGTDIDMGSQTFSVYYKGKVCKDYTISCADKNICKVTKNKNGTFTTTLLSGGQTKLTIKVGKEKAVFKYNVIIRIQLNYGPGVTKFNYMPASEPVITLSDGDKFGEDISKKQFRAVITVEGAASTKYTVTSSDPSICRVAKKKDGTLVIKRIKDGECIISVTAKDYTVEFHWKH